ncbi:MAG TPA: hypothetical protein VIX12_07255, partial [Candidatus Binataceae bacterium]
MILLLILILFGIAAVLAAANQDRIIAAILAEVKKNTGVEITAPSSHLFLANHLIIILDQPRVSHNDRQIMTLKELRVAVAYHSIIDNRGLPLYAITLTNPTITVLAAAQNAARGTALQPDKELADGLQGAIGELSRIARNIMLIGAELRDSTGNPLMDRVDITAFRTRRESHLWTISMNGAMTRAPIKGMRFTASLRLGRGQAASTEVARGQFLFRDAPLDAIALGGFSSPGNARGVVHFTMRDDGALSGTFDLGANGLALNSARLTSPISLGDLSLRATFAVAAQQIALENLVLLRSRQPLASGEARINQPFGAAPEIDASIGG